MVIEGLYLMKSNLESLDICATTQVMTKVVTNACATFQFDNKSPPIPTNQSKKNHHQ